MADKEYWLGTVGPLLYEDTDTYPDAEPMQGARFPQGYIEDAPTEDYHIARLGDVYDVINAGVFNVTNPAYAGGADPTGTTLSAAAFTACAAALQANGGGTFLIPPGVYKIWDTPANVTLCQFTGIDGINVISTGALLVDNPANNYDSNYIYLFNFSDCKNIVIDGFNIKGTRVTATSSGGMHFVLLQEGGQNVWLPNNYLEGVYTSLVASRVYTDPESYRSKNIHIGNLSIKDSYYGPLFQNSGDGVTVANLVTNGISRSYFAYGCRDHHSNIRSTGQLTGDCNLSSGGAYGASTEDIHINYTNVDTPVDTSRHIYFIYCHCREAAGHFDNITFNVNIDCPSTNVSNSYGFGVLLSADTPNAGNIMSNVTVSGRINGANVLRLSGYGASDYIHNLKIQNLRMTNSVVNSAMDLSALRDNLTMINVVSDKDITITNQPTGTQFNLVGVDVPNLTPNAICTQQTIAAYTSNAESSAYTGIDNAQTGSVYAQLSDLNALRVAYDNLRTSYDDLRTQLLSSTLVKV